MKVKNVNGSSRFLAPLGYSSWLDYWKVQSGKSVLFCSTTTCLGTDLVGGHVQKGNSTNRNYYIVPLCRSCNLRTDKFEVSQPLVPVPSNL
jgi:hypothetical protein